MDRIGWRRTFVWTALVLYIATMGLALFGVWQANSRQWYVDGAGMDITLNASFTDVARWVLTAVLGVLLLVGLAALVLDLIVARRAENLERMLGRVPPNAVAATYAPGATVEQETERATTAEVPPVRYEAAVVGDDATRRMERSVSPADAAVASSETATDTNGTVEGRVSQPGESDVRATLTRMERELDELRRRMESGEVPPHTETGSAEDSRSLSMAKGR